MRARMQDGVYFVGNMAGEAHPVIAEGISMAIQASHLLAQCLIAGRGADYAQQWHSRFAPRIKAASLFAHIAMNPITRSMARSIITAFPRILDWGARRSGKR
jgi:flavin-dependent dehydrogenase